MSQTGLADAMFGAVVIDSFNNRWVCVGSDLWTIEQSGYFRDIRAYSHHAISDPVLVREGLL